MVETYGHPLLPRQFWHGVRCLGKADSVSKLDSHGCRIINDAILRLLFFTIRYEDRMRAVGWMLDSRLLITKLTNRYQMFIQTQVSRERLEGLTTLPFWWTIITSRTIIPFLCLYIITTIHWSYPFFYGKRNQSLTVSLTSKVGSKSEKISFYFIYPPPIQNIGDFFWT